MTSPTPRGVFRTMEPAKPRALPRATLAYAPEGRLLPAPARRPDLVPPPERPTQPAPRVTLARPSVLPPEDGAIAAAATGERFQTVGTLGHGAMGEVALVLDHDLGRQVAVKRQLAGASDERFVREIRTLGRLEHPNIVPVHDVGREADGRLFFVMKKIEGETLEHVVERLRARDPGYVARFPFERRVEIVIGILHALAHAHASGVLHRDVKPENVMLGEHGEVQLVDWGIAAPFDAGRRPTTAEPVGVVVGTPWFMSPEQARGENDQLDARSDLYAVGALMHELLTLRHYLDGESDPAKVVAKVAAEGWTNTLLDWHRPGPGPMPPMELYHFVRRAMAFRRERRFASAEEMIAELHRIFEGRIRVQCPITLVKSGTRQAGRFVDRFPWTSFALTATTVGLAVWGAVRTVLDLI